MIAKLKIKAMYFEYVRLLNLKYICVVFFTTTLKKKFVINVVLFKLNQKQPLNNNL
jgi:hypothetical protein